MFIAAQFTIAKCWKQPRCPSVNEWVNKLWYIYTMEYYTAERKKVCRTVPSRGNVAQPPLGKASGERGSAGRTHAHR